MTCLSDRKGSRLDKKPQVYSWTCTRNERVGELRLSPVAAALLDDLKSTLPGLRLRAVLRELAEVPERSRKAYLLAASGKSRSAGIKVACLRCGKWNRGRVRRCTAYECPLWAYRPWD